MFQRQGPLDEALTQPRGGLGFCVRSAAGVVPEQLKPLPIKLSQPSLDGDLPDGVLTEKSAHDSHAHRFICCRWGCQNHRWKTFGHNAADRCSISRLKITIIVTLIREIKWLLGADRARQVAVEQLLFDVRGQAA